MIREQVDKQISLSEYGLEKRGISNPVLEKVAGLVDWKPVEQRIEQAYCKNFGRPAYEIGVMVRVMVLQHLYGLSDPAMEQALRERLSFIKFCGLSLEDAVPDETTICRFRQRLIQADMEQDLLGMVNEQLIEQGWMVKQAVIVDASLIRASRKPPVKGEHPQDPDADWTSRGKDEHHYGYKAHIKVDAQHTLVQKAELTAASVHDKTQLDNLLEKENDTLYADKGYADKIMRGLWKQQGKTCNLMHKAYRGQPLNSQQKEENKAIAKIRSRVERVFAHWKQWQHYRTVRYVGWLRNQLELTLKALSYNLKRIANRILQSPQPT